jgi:hypothetical protein
MKFKLEDHQVALNHVVLEDAKLCMELADTPLWKDQGIFEATLFINGLSVPAELIETTLQNLYSRCEEFYKEKYDVNNFDERVEARAVELLKTHADNALDKINRLTEILGEPDVQLTPYWERKFK